MNEMENTRCFLDGISEFEKLKYKVAEFFSSSPDDRTIEKLFGANPSLDERLAFSDVRLAVSRYDSINYPGGVYRAYQPKTEEDYKYQVQEANSGNLFFYTVSAWGFYYTERYMEAKKLFEDLAVAECSEGYAGLAWLYKRGEGVEQDWLKAVSCYEKAVLIDGNDQALLELGEYCRFQLNDIDKAIELIGRSACQGNSLAMAELSEIFSEIGREKESLDWAGRSAQFHCVSGYEILIKHYMRTNEGGKAFSLAAEYLMTELSPAYVLMGRCFLEGIGVLENVPRAIGFFEKATALDYPEAYYYLARAYAMMQDMDKFLENMRESAQKGFPPAIEFFEKDYPKWK